MGAKSNRLWCRRVAPVVILFALIVPSASASPIQWAEGLTPGPYAVGFETIEQYDLTRTVRPSVGYFGEPVAGEVERPLQIYIWYPARESSAARMVYGEYNFAYPDDEQFIAVLSSVQDREIALLQQLARGNQGLVLDLLSVEVHAIRDAEPVEGTHPLVIYAPHLGHGMAENSVLCEYLASHGFVVAGTFAAGATSLRADLDAEYLATQVRDLQFVLGTLRNDARVDFQNISAVGVGAGGVAVTLLAMQDSRVDAVAVLAPSRSALALRENNAFHIPDRLQSQLLTITAGPVDEVPHGWEDVYRYADRYWAPKAVEAATGLTHYDWIAAHVVDTTGQAQSATTAMHNTVCRDVHLFLTGGLEATSEELVRPDLVFLKPAEEAAPTADQLRGILYERGVETAAELFSRFDLAKVQPPVFSQRLLNTYGYQMLGAGRTEEAIVAFRMCTEIFPHSANAWDSYGEGLEQAGRLEEAVASYRRVLETIRTDSTANPQLLQQLREHAEEAIPRLEATINQ